MADIVLTQAWTPLGSTSNPFKGEFDGNYYKISGLKTTSTSSSHQGLFGATSEGKIRNLNIEGNIVRFWTSRNISRLY